MVIRRVVFINETKMRIGFLSVWGTDRGASMLVLNYCKMLKDQHELFVLKQGNNEISKNFDLQYVHITQSKNYEPEPKEFVTWLSTNKIDVVIFNEFGQWHTPKNDLVKIAKDFGVRTYAGELVIERFNIEQTKYYDRILAPTQTFVRFLRSNKVRKFTYIPFSLDMTEFKYEKILPDKFTFFHPAGMGGVYERKNTRAVLESFVKLNRLDTKLIISTQNYLDFKNNTGLDIEIINKNLSREDLLKLYSTVHVTVVPSKWESIGIPILESLASGTPVITTDYPPMSEFVQTGINGYLAYCDLVTYPNITVSAALVSTTSLKNCMENIMNDQLYDILSRKAKHIVKTKYDLDKNKEIFLKFLEGDLK